MGQGYGTGAVAGPTGQETGGRRQSTRPLASLDTVLPTASASGDVGANVQAQRRLPLAHAARFASSPASGATRCHAS